MDRMKVFWAALIILVVIGVVFVLSVPHTHDTGKTAVSDTAFATSTPVVLLHDVYKKGTHTLSGSVTLPNACSSVTAIATLVGDSTSTQSISLALTAPADEGVCLQVPTPATFNTTLSASNGLPLVVTVNGAVASTTAQ